MNNWDGYGFAPRDTFFYNQYQAAKLDDDERCQRDRRRPCSEDSAEYCSEQKKFSQRLKKRRPLKIVLKWNEKKGYYEPAEEEFVYQS